jgi:hypothetical protein
MYVFRAERANQTAMFLGTVPDNGRSQPLKRGSEQPNKIKSRRGFRQCDPCLPERISLKTFMPS